MYLLNPILQTFDLGSIGFTFHNVSIKSAVEPSTYDEVSIFTFHNVSIKSDAVEKYARGINSFTFHNVSIKS